MKDIFWTIQQTKRPPIGRSCLEEKLATTRASTAVPQHAELLEVTYPILPICNFHIPNGSLMGV